MHHHAAHDSSRVVAGLESHAELAALARLQDLAVVVEEARRAAAGGGDLLDHEVGVAEVADAELLLQGLLGQGVAEVEEDGAPR